MMMKAIVHELKHHAPFTVFGAVTGVLIVILGHDIPREMSHQIFYVLHPAHVFLSALATASMYQLYTCTEKRHACNPLALLLVGFVGAVGVATLSDSIIPYLAEGWLGMPHAESHIGIVEKPLLISGLAIAGVAIAYRWPQTKEPHAGHVLLSTWASLFHMMMALGDEVSGVMLVGVFVFLFIAVWFPCCMSDIIFPLLFVKRKA